MKVSFIDCIGITCVVLSVLLAFFWIWVSFKAVDIVQHHGLKTVVTQIWEGPVK